MQADRRTPIEQSNDINLKPGELIRIIDSNLFSGRIATYWTNSIIKRCSSELFFHQVNGTIVNTLRIGKYHVFQIAGIGNGNLGAYASKFYLNSSFQHDGCQLT